MTEEGKLQQKIMVECSKVAALFRVPAGVYKTEHGQYVRVAVKGFPDLCGFRRSDGKAVYIEVKTTTGRIRPEQQHFIDVARRAGALAGIARSVEEAMEVIKG